MAFQKLIAATCILFGVARGVKLSVSTTGGNASSPLLYGIIFEDINNSGDGGIHGQLLKNNGFQGDNPGLDAWSSVGDCTLSQDSSSPLTSAITSSLKVSVPSGGSGMVGIANAGYLGIPTNSDTYRSSFWIKGSYDGPVTVSLVGVSSKTVYASSEVSVQSTSDKFTQFNVTMSSQQAPDGNNAWQATLDAAKVSDGSVNFGLPQLFPTTYFNRENGLRNDVATVVADLKPSFLRFPGGNNLEGETVASRWKWNETIGPVENRPGRQGDWSYPNTDALGLMEYLDWCNDMSLEPILAIWSGLSLGGEIVTGDALQPYVDDALDELEFLFADTSTTYGALRAKYGHPEPYDIKFIEIGNEDFLAGGCPSYPERFMAFYDAIHAAYPNLQIITSTMEADCLPSTLPENVWTDIHHYLKPDDFVASFNEFDHIPRTGGNKVFVGEYGSTTHNDGSQTYWTNMIGSCAEAVYAFGIERNSDWVALSCFAPLLEHFDMAEWSPDLMGLNSNPGSITGSTSWYVQQLLSVNRGATILPVEFDSAFGPVYWVASASADERTYFLKMANYGTSSQEVTIDIPAASLNPAASLQLLASDDPNASNYPNDVKVQTVTSEVQANNGAWTVTLPPYAVSVLRMYAA